MKKTNSLSKLMLTVAVSTAIMISGNGFANASTNTSERVLQQEEIQEQVFNVLGVRRQSTSDNKDNEVCYLREATSKSERELQNRAIQEQISRFLGVRNNHNKDKYKLTKVSCDQISTQNLEIKKSEKEIQKERVQQQVRHLLGVRG